MPYLDALTPSGRSRVILAGEYRAIARNDNKTFESEFRVVAGVDREVEVIAR